MDLLLLNLSCKKKYLDNMEKSADYIPSLGLLSIGTYIKMHGYSVGFKDYNFEPFSYSALADLIRDDFPKFVGITVYTENAIVVGRISRFIKNISKETVVFVGGPHASLFPEYFDRYPSIDYVEIGEGETATIELMEGVLHGTIRIEDIETVRINRSQSKKRIRRITNLDLLPLIDRSIAGIEKFNNKVSIYSSKGCPSGCIYCSATALSGATFRIRSARCLFLECLMIKEQIDTHGEMYITFSDDTFTAIKKRAYEFIELKKKSGVKFLWFCESRVDVMDFELMDALCTSGCVNIQFGIESGSQSVLDKIGKNIRLEHAKELISYASKYPVILSLSFMLGHYCDTVKTMQETLQFMRDAYALNHNIVTAVSFNTPFPGTWQHSHSKEIGLKLLSTNYTEYDLDTPVVEGVGFSKEDLINAYQEAEAIMYQNHMDKLEFVNSLKEQKDNE